MLDKVLYVSFKSKLASRHEGGKELLKKLQIKTNPDNATHNILAYKVVLIEIWWNFKYHYSFHNPKVSFVLQFFHV